MLAAFELEASPPADWPPCALGPASVQMTAGFQARLGCDACTRRLKEIDATLAMGMRHPPTLSSQREAGHAREPRGASRLAKSSTGQNTVASFGSGEASPTKPSLLRVSKRQRLPGLIHALKTALALPSPQPLTFFGLSLGAGLLPPLFPGDSTSNK